MEAAGARIPKDAPKHRRSSRPAQLVRNELFHATCYMLCAIVALPASMIAVDLIDRALPVAVVRSRVVTRRSSCAGCQ